MPRAEPSLFPRPLEDAGARYARVAIDRPVRREFSYRVPPGLEPLQPGCRVRAPFGSLSVLGVVVGLDPHPPEGVPPSRLRALLARLDAQPLLTPGLLRLARHIADTTYCSWGNALAAMLPAALRRESERRSIPMVELARSPTAEERALLRRRHDKQERALAYLEAAGGPMEMAQLLARAGLSRSPLDSLRKRGLLRFTRRREFLDPFQDAPAVPDRPPELTPEQGAAVAEIGAALEQGRHERFLLFGVTSSGKTEVYLRALQRCLELGRSAIILVPEIALTPQTVARFRARVGEVAVLHSGLSDAERHDQWSALAAGRRRVVVGARSALFAPAQRLGLIVVDEEHEGSFQQESAPRYHAREVALERARLEQAVCVLGSATPALESWQAAREGRLRRLDLPRRVAGGRLPEVTVVDMRRQKPQQGHWLVVSEPLRQALEQSLERAERAILFLNQRGFAPAWHCRACGGSVHCPRCDVALTYHRWRRCALCHYCLQEAAPPERCKACGAPVVLVGVGTERAEEALQRMFPAARVARMDRDTMLRRESYERVLADFGAGRVDFLLGTQMVAKGLDFPEVTVVGVLNADSSLHHPDFRAAERCFDLVAQVSGRAGRGPRGGRVVVQTWRPEHPAIRAAVRHDYPAFAEQELEERRAFAYPPCARVVRVLVEAEDGPRADRLAAAAAAELRTAAAPSCQVLGPAAMPVERLRDRVRRQVLLKEAGRDALRSVEEVLYALCQKDGVRVLPL